MSSITTSEQAKMLLSLVRTRLAILSRQRDAGKATKSISTLITREISTLSAWLKVNSDKHLAHMPDENTLIFGQQTVLRPTGECDYVTVGCWVLFNSKYGINEPIHTTELFEYLPRILTQSS